MRPFFSIAIGITFLFAGCAEDTGSATKSDAGDECVTREECRDGMAAGAPLAVRYREVVDETFYGGELLESSTYSGANVFSSKEAYQEAAERVDAKYSWVDAINWDDEQLVVFVAGFGADDVRFHTLDYRFGRSGDGLQLDIHFVGLSYCTCDCFIFQISRALIVDRSAGIISDVQIHEQPACADAPVLPDDGADIGDAGL